MTKEEFRKLVEDKVAILDGATGTELTKRGMPAGVCPEMWCLEHPEAIRAIQQAYVAAGSDIVYVPSFGGNRFKLAEFGLEREVHSINAALARISCDGVSGDAAVFGDLAPTGQFIRPYGEIEFETAVEVYREQVAGLLAGGVDGFAIETMMDLQEARAALLAVRERCDLPVMVTMTFEASGRSLTGNDPVAALVALQALGADAFGCNCSTGPGDMAQIIRQLRPYAEIPLVAKPNAGLPQFRDGRTVFSMDAAEFGGFAAVLAEAGAQIIGGCCGTTPEHIAALAENAIAAVPAPVGPEITGVVSSSRRFRVLAPDQPFAVIGERINPTGKKALQAQLREGKTDLVFEFATEQTAHGAALLDINMGLSGIDERAMMIRAIEVASQSSDLPLVIDSTCPEVVETALRYYPGRALLNSISAERERLEKVLPIAARYGAMLILLPLTDDGIPASVAGRIEVVKRIFREAERYGYRKCDICVDALVMTVSANPEAAAVTLDLIEWCSRNFGCNSVCGLSNVSFGLPSRPLVNLAFLGMAIGRGLNLAIANPMADEIMQLAAASDVLNGRDRQMRNFLALFGNAPKTPEPDIAQLSPTDKVARCVLKGDRDGVCGAIDAALTAGVALSNLVDDCLIRAITEVGDKFERKEYFLPQLIASADTMRRAMEYLAPHLAANGGGEAERIPIILATVKGDIHDIGKNIVGIMLRNYGFEVVDLGKDVAAEVILDTAAKRGIKLIGLSALMTTTMTQMQTVIDMARARGMDDVRFIVGGAVVDREFAASIGAEYAADALAAVRLAQQLTQR